MLNEVVFIGALVLFALGVVWLAMKTSEKKGAAQERAARAKEDADATRKAGAIIAEHRSDDDTVDRLRSNKF
jgi:cbb3-type cytochrome oxidase subunit 3